jgi:ADP-ribose pyrophosphatase YjhB (NUDIX family)
MDKQIETVSRAVIVKGDEILLCKTKNSQFYFLPGGHVEFGETAAVALARELKEELGVETVSADFMGSLENLYQQNGDEFHEYNFIFRAEISGEINATEPHIEFEWRKLSELKDLNLRPELMKNVILQNSFGFFLSQKD